MLSFQPLSVHVGLWPTSLMSTGWARCHWAWWENEPFSATLAKDGLAECNQPWKNLLKFSTTAGNCTGHEEDRQWDSSISPLSYCDWQAMYSQLYILNGSAYSEERQYYCLYFVKRKSTTNSFLPANISGVPEDVGMNLTDSLYTSYGCGGNSARTPLGWI